METMLLPERKDLVESTIQAILMCPDSPPRVTSFSPAEAATRISPPRGSFVTHEIITPRCPKGMGFGLAVICPVGSVLLTRQNQDQFLAATAILGRATAGACFKPLR